MQANKIRRSLRQCKTSGKGERRKNEGGKDNNHHKREEGKKMYYICRYREGSGKFTARE